MTEVNLAISELGGSSDEALRKLLLRRINETTDANQRFEALADNIRTNAAVFASVLRGSSAMTDTAVHRYVVREGTFFHQAEYANDKYPVWYVHQDYKYGGVEALSTDKRVHTLAIRYSGELAVVRWRGNQTTSSIDPDEDTLPAWRFINRANADSEEGLRRVQTEWLDDLEAAAQRYSRQPFSGFTVKGRR